MTPDVRPGDLLCYRGTGVFAQAIRLKTWSDISHVEVALNPHYTITARAEGVQLYPYTREHLYAVQRPLGSLDFGAAMQWFQSVLGAPYDYVSLLLFYGLTKDRNARGMHCAEVCTRWYRAAGFHPFAADYPAGKVSPGMYLAAVPFAQVYHV